MILQIKVTDPHVALATIPSLRQFIWVEGNGVHPTIVELAIEASADNSQAVDAIGVFLSTAIDPGSLRSINHTFFNPSYGLNRDSRAGVTSHSVAGSVVHDGVCGRVAPDALLHLDYELHDQQSGAGVVKLSGLQIAPGECCWLRFSFTMFLIPRTTGLNRRLIHFNCFDHTVLPSTLRNTPGTEAIVLTQMGAHDEMGGFDIVFILPEHARRVAMEAPDVHYYPLDYDHLCDPVVGLERAAYVFRGVFWTKRPILDSHLCMSGMLEYECLEDASGRVFIGHGRSALWREVKDFIVDELGLEYEEFDRLSVAGLSITDRLSEMLASAGFAILVMTAEDQNSDGTVHARDNVIHEAGLFHGRHGWGRVVLLLEDSCAEFSNIRGLVHVRFNASTIRAAFPDVRRALEREGFCSVKHSG